MVCAAAVSLSFNSLLHVMKCSGFIYSCGEFWMVMKVEKPVSSIGFTDAPRGAHLLLLPRLLAAVCYSVTGCGPGS